MDTNLSAVLKRQEIITLHENRIAVNKKVKYSNSWLYGSISFVLDHNPENLYDALDQGLVYKIENNKVYLWYKEPGEFGKEHWLEIIQYKAIETRVDFVLKKLI